MNKERRETIQRMAVQVSEAADEIRFAADEEESAWDNMPENLQWAERGVAMQDTISELQEIESELNDIMARLEEIAER